MSKDTKPAETPARREPSAGDPISDHAKATEKTRVLLSSLPVVGPDKEPAASAKAREPGDICECKVKHGSLVASDGVYTRGASCLLTYAEASRLAAAGVIEIL